jgi:hypothetical protein
MIRGGGLIERFLMATDALRRQTEPVELAHGPHLVAGIAVHHGVRANQRKPVLVFIDVMN